MKIIPITIELAATRVCCNDLFNTCKASGCMAWCWADGETKLGYCGLVH